MANLTSKIAFSTAEYRPCYVYGKKALFHRWEQKKTPIITLNGIYSDEALERKVKSLILDSRATVNFQAADYGIVEYDDGTVAEVEPSKIRFVPGIMKDFSFDDVSYHLEIVKDGDEK